MLEIKNITKTYKTEGFTQKALNNVSASFRECEFASILGPSGSGKTTLLNIIGGLDKYDSGDLIINGISTKKYKDSNWDSYRNHRVGFVFQSYNLITHQTVLSNVRLALTLSGISKKEAIKRAKKVLKDVGLEDHIYKKPNQLSGGQMQRVAIARALVNDPDILLADEPTGALDSETSIQIMELLKEIAKEKLVIMVTHNPDLAEAYSSRIIKLKDGKIISDTNPYKEEKEKEQEEIKRKKSKKTTMSFFTALTLSFNNLMTKKGRTILVSFAGSIGIIGIALILAVSTGFQNYVDHIQEDTLTSYPLTLAEEATDITGLLLSMQESKNQKSEKGKVKEQQYITSMFSNIKANDLKSFNEYTKKNYKKIEKDISSIKYNYSIDPYIYTIDATNTLARINPNNLFSSMMGGGISSQFTTFSSIFSQMIDDKNTLDQQYEVLAGRWPEKYNELIIVLSEANSISDLLVYSLGLRDTKELTDMINKITTGKAVDKVNKPLELTYEDLLNIKLKLIEPTNLYKYNDSYNVYEDMSQDNNYMIDLYNKSEDLKIVGIVTSKEGVSSTALSPGVSYRHDLIEHIINYAKDTDIVKKQLANEEIDVFSGKRFDSEKNTDALNFQNMINIDTSKIKNAFNINIDEEKIKNETAKKMAEISNSITTNIDPAKEDYVVTMKDLLTGLYESIQDSISLNEIDEKVSNYLDSEQANINLQALEDVYVIPKQFFKDTYNMILKGFLQIYIQTYAAMDPSITIDENNPVAKKNDNIKDMLLNTYIENIIESKAPDKMAKGMTEAVMKKEILGKVGELTTFITVEIANAFQIDQESIESAFQFNLKEEEVTRVITAMMNQKESTCKSNLISLGYQNLEEPTFISYYFTSFEGKEHFIKFLEKYNKKYEKLKEESKVIRYSDTTGIIMNSVKTIVNAVSYVLIAFVSISLIVSSIMIGIITYISVYERTKEIGILRAIGASKRNISSIFNAETFIIGLLSGLIGIGITYIDIPIINHILHKFTGNIPLRAALNTSSAITLVLLSVILTLIGGLIPAKKASKRDPVEALRSE